MNDVILERELNRFVEFWDKTVYIADTRGIDTSFELRNCKSCYYQPIRFYLQNRGDGDWRLHDGAWLHETRPVTYDNIVKREYMSKMERILSDCRCELFSAEGTVKSGKTLFEIQSSEKVRSNNLREKLSEIITAVLQIDLLD